MSKANPLAGKTKKELEAMLADKESNRKDHVRHANRLAKEVAAIKREIENKEQAEKIKELEAALKAAKGTARK